MLVDSKSPVFHEGGSEVCADFQGLVEANRSYRRDQYLSMFSAQMARDKHCGGETPAVAHTHHTEGRGGK